MPQSVIAALEAAARVATEERIAAEMRERTAMFATEDAKDAAGKAARRRAELVEALEQADAAEQAGRDRLGPCRLAHADAERESERLADAAALGSDAAARSLAKSRDAIETAAALVLAHERRVRVLVGQREEAEQALAAHDAAELARVAALLEQLLLRAAEHVDKTLAGAVDQAVKVRELYAQRDTMTDALGRRARVGWSVALANPGNLYGVLRLAFFKAGNPINPERRMMGQDFGQGMAVAAQQAIDSWNTIRGAGQSAPLAAPSQPAPVPSSLPPSADLALPPDPGERAPDEDGPLPAAA